MGALGGGARGGTCMTACCVALDRCNARGGRSRFPVKERELATTIASLLNPLGNAAGSVVPPIMVNAPGDMPGSLLMQGIMSAAVAAFATAFFKEGCVCCSCRLLIFPFVVVVWWWWPAAATAVSVATTTIMSHHRCGCCGVADTRTAGRRRHRAAPHRCDTSCAQTASARSTAAWAARRHPRDSSWCSRRGSSCCGTRTLSC